MYAAKAVIGALMAGIAVLVNALQGGRHTLYLVDYLMALNAALAVFVAVYFVPNKGSQTVSLSTDDVTKAVTKALSVYDVATEKYLPTEAATRVEFHDPVPVVAPPVAAPPVVAPAPMPPAPAQPPAGA